ncbi:Glycoside hydrolase [Mycena venus]|uniref:Glycoside hydrolase n=1 Tax=Mycena venus TaxID=2733690 RepID=A0A8H6WYJ0_9AGAR|nr:Glycoside hydrolase [Mycena venus]
MDSRRHREIISYFHDTIGDGKQRVLLLGATGETGGSILRALLEDPDSFDVEALVRPASKDKPQVKALADRGIKTHLADIEGPIDGLVDILAGVDVLISAIDAMSQLAQIKLVTAAKEAGVKRFVPCAFTTVAPAGGVMMLRDTKEEVYQHIRKLYLPYTVIDVGYWYQLSFPTLPSGRVDYACMLKPKVEIHNGGSMPNIVTDERDIGSFVALIIKDPRTLNKYVVAYGDVLSENEIFEIMEELSGEKIERKFVSLSLPTRSRLHAQKNAAVLKADPNNRLARIGVFREDYHYSKYVRGDNTPKYATYLGYFDARALYPDFKPKEFRAFARELLDGKIEQPYKDRVFA